MLNKKIESQEDVKVLKQMISQSIGLFNLTHRCYEYGLDIRLDSQAIKRLLPLNVSLIDIVGKYSELSEEWFFPQRNTIRFLTGKVTQYVNSSAKKVDEGGALDNTDIVGIALVYRSILDSLFDICSECYVLFKNSNMMDTLETNEVNLLTRAYANPGEFYVKDEGTRPEQRFLATADESRRAIEGTYDEVEDNDEYDE